MLLSLLAAISVSTQADVRLRADSTRRAAELPAGPRVHVFIDDTTAAPVVFTALAAELRLDDAGGTPRAGARSAPTMTAELRLTKRADALTSVLAARVAAARRVAAVVVELPSAGDTLRVRLVDARIVTERLVFPAASDVTGQRLPLEVTVTQLAADREDAARQLNEAIAVARAESRAETRLVPANAIARARDQVTILDARLAAARRQLTLFDERATAAAAPTEEVTLRAERAEVLGSVRP